MNDSAEISPDALVERSQARNGTRSKWTPILAFVLSAAVLVHLVNVLIKNPYPATGIPAETTVGPQRVKLPIAGLPRSGEPGVVQDDVSALWLGAAQAIQTGYCAGVDHGAIVAEKTPDGLQSVPGVYVVSCATDISAPGRSYMFHKTTNGVSPCEDLTACKQAQLSPTTAG